MKKFLWALLATTMLVACSNGDKTTVINNSDRVALLEARANLNDANDALLAGRVTSLENRMTAVEGNVSSLQSDVAAYQAATDASLAQLAQNDADLASDIADANSAILALQSTDTSLQSQISSLAGRVTTLETRLQGVEGSYPTLAARLNAMKNSLSSLNSDVNSLQAFRALQIAQNLFVQLQIASLDSRIANNTASISSLTTQVTNLTTQVNNFQTQTNSALADLQSQITNIQLIPGPQGDQGASGKSAYELWLDNGNSGSEAQFLASLIGAQGPQGIQGLIGPQGVQGPQGIPGPAGATGATGAAGSSVQAVQLCAGDTATYPEQGLIIGGKTYAVYYGAINGVTQAFLTLLQAGSWVTTDGGNCHFTVDSSNNIVPPTPVVVIPSGATHELLLCGIVSYKVPGGVVVNGTTYTSNTTLTVASGSCTITNPSSNSVSSNGQSGLGGAQSCNYNGIPSVSSTTPVYQSGASSNLCYIKHL